MQNDSGTRKLTLDSENGWAELRAIFSDPLRILILTHKNPDGDAVGSALGLKWFLSKSGHQVEIAIPDDSPGFLKWLPGHQDIFVHDRKSGKEIPQLFRECDFIVCVDFNTPERLGSVESLLRAADKPSLLIDHHPDGVVFTDIFLVDPSMGSTAELLYHMIRKLDFEGQISAEGATCLLAGILTDTVGLKVSCSYPGVFETVAALMRLGAEKDRIYKEIYNMFSADRMRLLGYSLDRNMKIIPDYRTAYIALTNKELNSYNHRKGDTEGFVNYPLSISGVVFSVLFTEQTDHIKLSLRSRGSFPANEFARLHFHGGGHRNAAGGRFFGTMDQALAFFESCLDEFRDLLVLDDL
jgi:phosphoesterase RecJ-like protein